MINHQKLKTIEDGYVINDRNGELIRDKNGKLVTYPVLDERVIKMYEAE